MKHNFKKLEIWQDSMNFCNALYDYTEKLPSKEKFNLAQQLERCSVSIPSNIAEGSGKRTALHFSEFITTSLSSSYELETQLLICQRRNYGDKDELIGLLKQIEVLQKRIFNFREKITENSK
jgi:four helix bundle protein